MKKPVIDTTSASQLRKHYFLDRYVVIAPKRSMRPEELATRNTSHTIETSTSPAIEDDPAIYQVTDRRGHWMVKVIVNKFPALSLDNPQAYGKQEIIIETPIHNREFSSLPIAQIMRIFDAYANRTSSLRKIKNIRHVAVFKNDGPRAGASIAHAHSQIIALPIVPPLLAYESLGMINYAHEYEACAYCHVVDWERRKKVRVVSNSRHILAYAPYASENPFEVWINPKRHVSTFADLKQEELHEIAVILQKVTRFLDKNQISFNFFLQDSLIGYNHHFVLKVEPRQTLWGGLELSTGVIINPVAPEEAAKWYRENSE